MSRSLWWGISLALLLSLSLAGCGDEKESTTPDTVLADTNEADQRADAPPSDTNIEDLGPGDTTESDTKTPDADTTASDTAVGDSSDTIGDDTTVTGDAADADVDLCGLVTDFEKGCASDENCVVGIHQVDCCGNTEAIGINHSERDRFDGLEAACQATYPACGCASGPTLAEDGEVGWNIGVRCDAGVCTTFSGDAFCESVVDVEKGCGTTENCSIGWHQVDCCGSLTAIGMNHSELAAFEAEEAICVSTQPICDCPTQQPTAEDGKSASDTSLVEVTCNAGTCETYVP